MAGANKQESRELAASEARLNRVNQVTPFGNLTYSGPLDERGQVDPYNTTVTTTLSPEQQRLLELRQQAEQLVTQRGSDLLAAAPAPGQPVLSFGDQPLLPHGDQPALPDHYGPGAQTGVGNRFSLLNMLPRNLDFETSRAAVEDATFERAMRLMRPEFNREEGRMLQRLANQGLPQAGEAYGSETTVFNRARNRAMNDAAIAAVLAGGQEQSRQLADLLGTSAAGLGQAQWQRENLDREALAARDVATREALAARDVATREALLERQVPGAEAMSLLNLQPPQVTGGDFMAPPATQMRDLSTPGSGSMPFGQQLALGLIGAGGNVANGYFAGR